MGPTESLPEYQPAHMELHKDRQKLLPQKKVTRELVVNRMTPTVHTGQETILVLTAKEEATEG